MKLVTVSNYFNIHQKPLAEQFSQIYGGDYAFIATSQFNAKRLAVGYRDMNQDSLVFRAYESQSAMSEAQRMIDDAECVIVAGLPVLVISSRLNSGRITFMQSERFFKGPFWKDAVRFVKYSRYSGGRSQARNPLSKFYLLCASAFAAWDYNTCGLFKGKAYRWGYFPEARRHDDIAGMISRKKQGSILWVGRFLDWKHPDFAVKLAANLRDMGLDFSVKIVGSGEMNDTLRAMIEAQNLSDRVELAGSMPTEQVRGEMEKSQIFLFTSGRAEGWGVVLNEAMNSSCAVIAGEKAGSTPYLVRDGVNGLIFRDKDIDDLTRKVAGLLRQPERIPELGRNAYESVTGEWSPGEAARRFVRLAEALNESAGPVRLWEDGPCSIAPVL